MSDNVVNFQHQEAIAEEAAAWLVKLDGDGAPSAQELASLREWLARSSAHREQLHSLAVLWGNMNVLTELAVPLGRAKSGRKPHLLAGLNRAVLATAVVALGIGIAAALWSQPEPVLHETGFHATAVGQQESATLSDGSVVLLNTNSQIRVDFNDKFRSVHLLQGEAHFTVVKSTSRPFRVYAGSGIVEAVGTAFSVYVKDSAIDVTVTEGSVALASVSRPAASRDRQQAATGDGVPSSGTNAIGDIHTDEALVMVKAGESATIRNLIDAEPVSTIKTIKTIETVEAQQMVRRLSWRDGILTFSGEPLERVVEEISRYTTVSIEIRDPEVRATRIGGRFPIGETDAMFEHLETNFDLRVTRLGHNSILLSAAED